jgi:hypothetical protein
VKTLRRYPGAGRRVLGSGDLTDLYYRRCCNPHWKVPECDTEAILLLTLAVISRRNKTPSLILIVEPALSAGFHRESFPTDLSAGG